MLKTLTLLATQLILIANIAHASQKIEYFVCTPKKGHTQKINPSEKISFDCSENAEQNPICKPMRFEKDKLSQNGGFYEYKDDSNESRSVNLKISRRDGNFIYERIHESWERGAVYFRDNSFREGVCELKSETLKF